jgi:hypothetical protein
MNSTNQIRTGAFIFMKYGSVKLLLINTLSTRKTLAEADFGRSFSVVAGPRLNADAFILGSRDGPDELYSFYFVVVW